MSSLLLSNRDKTYAVRNFYTTHPLSNGISYGDKDITKISFKKFCELLKVSLTPDQINVACLVANQKVTSVVSSHGVGKSELSAILLLYYVICKRGLVITTSPTRRQVVEIIFTAVSRNYRRLAKNPRVKNEYGIDLRKDFSLGQSFIREVDDIQRAKDSDDRYWFEKLAIEEEIDLDEDADSYDGIGYAFGFSSSDTNQHAVQGIHSSGDMLCVVDEACGVSRNVIDGINAIATGATNKILLIGNPVTRGNAFEEISRKGCYKMTGFNHPNCKPYYDYKNGKWLLADDTCLKPGWKPVIQGAVTPRWIEDCRERYGTDSLYWQTRVLATFPRLGQGAGQLISPNYVEKAHEGYQPTSDETEETAYSPLLVGVDLSENKDRTVITVAQFFKDRDNSIHSIRKRHRLWIRGIFEIEVRGNDMLQQERNKDEVIRIVTDYLMGTNLGDHNVVVALDGTGLGVSLAKDLTKETKFKVLPVHFNASAMQPRAFINVRAEMYWWLKHCYERGVIKLSEAISNKDKEQLAYELSGTRYEQDPKTDRIMIIPKDEIISILGVSPDYADSAALVTRALYENFPDIFEAVK